MIGRSRAEFGTKCDTTLSCYGIEGGVIIGKNFIDFFHVSEHVDHFKAIKVFSLRKKPEMVWLGGTPPPWGLAKDQTISGFFL